MEKDIPIFRTLLTKDEYNFLLKKHPGDGNTQTNYYFDTKEFSLKAFGVVFRIKEKENNIYELAIKRKKSYSIEELTEVLTKEQFDTIMNEGVLTSDRGSSAIQDIVKGRKLKNYLSLSTFRCSFNYGTNVAHIDRCKYLGKEDFELEFHALNYEDGKKAFINLMKEMNITYKKCETKIKRSYNALIEYI